MTKPKYAAPVIEQIPLAALLSELGELRELAAAGLLADEELLELLEVAKRVHARAYARASKEDVSDGQ